MSSLAVSRDAFAPQRPPGMRSGLVLALIVHVLLVLALAWSVNWKTHEPEGVAAELWSALPQFAAPRVAAPEPRPPVVEPRPTPPVPRPEPVTPPREDAQIAIERAEAKKRAELAKREETRRIEAERERERERERIADAQVEKKKQAEKARQDALKEAASREAYLRRMMKQAGTSDDPNSAGDAARTSGPSATYAGRIKAAIKPHIKPAGSISGNPLAIVEVRLASDGSIVSQRLVKSSGSPVWDDAVLRAVEKTAILPRDEGRVYSPMTLEFRPQE